MLWAPRRDFVLVKPLRSLRAQEAAPGPVSLLVLSSEDTLSPQHLAPVSCVLLPDNPVHALPPEMYLCSVLSLVPRHHQLIQSEDVYQNDS